MKAAHNGNKVKFDIGFMSSAELTELNVFAQVIPSSMMQALAKTAKEKGVSLELEVASRLARNFHGCESAR